MNFKDFKDDYSKLEGQYVLWEVGSSYSSSRNRYIRKITKVTKTGFRIDDLPDALFSLSDGCRKGLNSRMDMATISQCSLISEQYADELRATWAANRLKQERLKYITEMLPKLDGSLVSDIFNLINKTNKA